MRQDGLEVRAPEQRNERLHRSVILLALLSLSILAFVGFGGAARVGHDLVEYRQAYAYTMPAMIAMLLLVFFPFFYGIALSFTNQNIYVQFIDDLAGVTLAAASTRSKAAAKEKKVGANVETAKRIGALAAEAAKSKGIKEIVFDRSGARYHGKVKALADAAREAGLKF